jgi:hypothetical protein
LSSRQRAEAGEDDRGNRAGGAIAA